jgi:putative endonuclease
MYILKCADRSLYTGSTNDLQRKISEHESGYGANYTKSRLPIQLVYYEEYSRIDEAFYREKQLHRWGHKNKLALIEDNNKILPKLAKKTFRK